MTLRTRIAFWFAGLLAAMIILFSIAVFGLMWWSMVSDVDATLEESAVAIAASSIVVDIPLPEPSRISVDLPRLDFLSASGTEVQIWITEGATPELVDSTHDADEFHEPFDPKTLGSTSDNAFSTVNIGQAWWRVHTSPISYRSEVVGKIQVARSIEPMYDAVRSLLAVVLACSLFAIGGAIILSRWLADHVLAPVQDLTAAASRIAGASDLSTRLTWTGPNDELGRLIAVFNRMMERIQGVFSIQQRFVADISHELRTPLTGIIGNVDLMRRYGADDDSLNAIHADTARMSRLVHDLLMLARADYGGTSIHPMQLDADAVIESAVKAAHPAAEQKNIALIIGHVEPLRVMGDPQQLQQMLDNLIDNAIKFTAPGGQITLTMQRVDQAARIEVTDTGIGIPTEHQLRVFDRFYQVDTARTQDGTGGFGLGLSVARWIAEAHHGSIEVRSQPGAGSTFTVHLPLVSAYTETTNISRRIGEARLQKPRYEDTPPADDPGQPMPANGGHSASGQQRSR
jgi:two-component system, OmpR family, sensor kinase